MKYLEKATPLTQKIYWWSPRDGKGGVRENGE